LDPVLIVIRLTDRGDTVYVFGKRPASGSTEVVVRRGGAGTDGFYVKLDGSGCSFMVSKDTFKFYRCAIAFVCQWLTALWCFEGHFWVTARGCKQGQLLIISGEIE
jgi:hypothetical protein